MSEESRKAESEALAAVKVPAKFRKDPSADQGYRFGAATPRPLSTIAREVYRDWKPVNYAAKPYLEALASLTSVGDNYGADSGRSVVLYFLANAQTWRGGVAKHIKAELQAMLDHADVTVTVHPAQAAYSRRAGERTVYAAISNRLDD